jgi:hypothetical protein
MLCAARDACNMELLNPVKRCTWYKSQPAILSSASGTQITSSWQEVVLLSWLQGGRQYPTKQPPFDDTQTQEFCAPLPLAVPQPALLPPPMFAQATTQVTQHD